MKVFVPILNGAKNKWRVPIVLGPDLSIVELDGEDYAACIGSSPETIRSSVPRATLAIRVDNVVATDAVIQDIEATAFVLNAQRDGPRLHSPFAISDGDTWPARQLPYMRDGGSTTKWKLGRVMNAGELATLVSIVRKMCRETVTPRISVQRWRQALYRPDHVDRIIDLAIALESLVYGTSEVSFKCALFNAALVETQPAPRQAVYQDFKELYDVRSKLVHGSLEPDSADVIALTAKLDDLQSKGAAAILKFVLFLETLRDPGTGNLPGRERIERAWQAHQLALVFGTA